jgi:Asp/Glu/hydantoin racemase
MRLVLINPNTAATTTEAMLSIARATAPDVEIDGVTATFGAALITNPSELAVASDAVEALAAEISRLQPDGVIVAAFGDPGLRPLRERLACPVTGIAEAGMAAAAHGDRRFAVVTTTPDLASSIQRAAEAYGHGDLFLGTALTDGDPAQLMERPDQLEAAMAAACRRAIADLGAQAIVIGGGPLALVARQLQAQFETPIIEPIPAAVRLALARAGQGGQARPLVL